MNIPEWLVQFFAVWGFIDCIVGIVGFIAKRTNVEVEITIDEKEPEDRLKRKYYDPGRYESE
jgi:hypothetical protein